MLCEGRKSSLSFPASHGRGEGLAFPEPSPGLSSAPVSSSGKRSVLTHTLTFARSSVINNRENTKTIRHSEGGVRVLEQGGLGSPVTSKVTLLSNQHNLLPAGLWWRG